MHSRFGKRGVLLAGLLATALGAFAPAVAEAKPEPGAKPRGFRLFASALGAITVNRVYCGLAATGEVCVDSTNSPNAGGGFWPKGTPNQYVFNSGLQLAGKIGPDGGPWAGRTTGAFFFDPKGTTQHGEKVTDIYNTSNPADLAFLTDETTCDETCQAAKVPQGDATADIYNPLLQGRAQASQGDIWFMSWDGNPAQIAGRQNPLGVVVETRGLGWNYPSGNEDIVYFVYTFYNVTTTDPAKYATVRPGMRELLLAKATEFQTKNEAQFGVQLPDGGYTIDSLFAAFAADPDVAAAGTNYSSVNLPFALGYTYERSFGVAAANGWTFDPGIFSGNFFAGTGFFGVKYLQSPTGAGEIQLFSNTLNGTGFNDAANTVQLFRYLSGNISTAAGDASCNTGNQRETRVCYIAPAAADSRFFQSSTPLRLGPGEFGSIVVAYIFAAPARVPGQTFPQADVTPGDPRKLTNTPGLLGDDVNLVDRLTGYLDYSDLNADGTPQQNEFTVVPGSLLGKSLTAQAVFDSKFLLPFAPESPEFFLVPGDNQVTVLWRPSRSEAIGDPFFALASAPTSVNPETGITEVNPLYDPNYRQFDVEGYRIYRGRVDSPNEFRLLAQFDYAGTSINDFRGVINPTAGCAPELGINVDCAEEFETFVPGQPLTVFHPVALVGQITQVRIGGRAPLGNGAVVDSIAVTDADTLSGTGTPEDPFVIDTIATDTTKVFRSSAATLLSADTATSGGGTSGTCAPNACPDLEDTNVPFVFTDNTVRNGNLYFYSVTAFDVNSFTSGPSSLESPRTTKRVVPAPASVTTELASEFEFELLDDQGNVLANEAEEGTTSSQVLTIDPSTGRFNGRPPVNLQVRGVIDQAVLALAPAISAANPLIAQIDSVKIRADGEAYPRDGIGAFNCAGLSNGQGLCQEYYVSFSYGDTRAQTRTPVYVPILSQTFGDDQFVTADLNPGPVPISPTVQAQFGIPSSVSPSAAALSIDIPRHGELSAGEQFHGRRATSGAAPGGSRWFSGPNETVDDPAYSIRVGSLPGVDTIFATLSHIDLDPATAGSQTSGYSVCQQMHGYGITPFGRQADIELTWGAGGAIASVRDVTHGVDIPFKKTPQSSWGLVPDTDGDGIIGWADIYGVEEVSQVLTHLAFCGDGTDMPAPRAAGEGDSLRNTVAVVPVSSNTEAGLPGEFVATGNGFGLYVAGHYHIFQLTGGALPAAGTKWTLRSYSGPVTASTETRSTANPEGYAFTQNPGNPAIAGLRFRYTIPNPTVERPVEAADIANVHTVPDPYYVTNTLERTTEDKILKFVNLPTQATIRIYTSSGVLVRVLEKTGDPSSEFTWDLRNRNQQFVASGVYFYHVESAGARKVGRFTVINFAR